MIDVFSPAVKMMMEDLTVLVIRTRLLWQYTEVKI